MSQYSSSPVRENWDNVLLSSNTELPVLSVHHISRNTSNVDRMTKFYCNVLGFKKLNRPKRKFKGAWLQLKDIQIHIIERNIETELMESPYNNNGKSHQKPVALRRGPHVAWLTNDFDTVIKKLDKFGIEYHIKDTKQESRKQVWFYDCDGYGIEIMEYQDINSKL